MCMNKMVSVLGLSVLAMVVSPGLSAITEPTFADLVRHNDFKAAKQRLFAGVDINARDEDGWTLLHHVVCFTEPQKAARKQVAFLLANGAKVKLRDKIHKETAFEMAVAQSKISLVQLLLTRSGPRITATNKFGKLAVRRAFYDDNLELLTLLTKHGAVVTNLMAAWARVNLKRKIADFLEALMAEQNMQPKKRKRKGVPHRSVKKREICPKSPVEKFKP